MEEVRPRLLDHPFYQAWTRGELPLESLAAYHRAYTGFIARIPSWWDTVVTHFGETSLLARTVVKEEESHIELWKRWGRDLPEPVSPPSLAYTINAFDDLSPAGLLGALQSFEIQQPEVARTKKEGLIRHYGFSPNALQYFDEHQKEEKHINFGARIAELANESEYAEGFALGASLVYRSLDEFVAPGRC